jgi:hypothetical protein
MGDNRCASEDSRAFGAIDASAIIGRAFVSIWGAVDDEPLSRPAYPPGTSVVPEAHAGVIAGYIDSQYIGLQPGGPHPPGMPGIPITNETGTLLYGYDIVDIGAVRRSIAEDPKKLALLRSCSHGRKHDTPACAPILDAARQPFGLDIPIPKASPPTTTAPR